MTPIFLLLFVFLFNGINGFRPLNPNERDRIQEICGRIPNNGAKKRSIYGGEEISGDKAPWTLYLKFGKFRCSGTLISSRHILTATHCLQTNSTDRNAFLDPSTRVCDHNDMIYTQNHHEFKVYDSARRFLSYSVSKVTLLSMCRQDDIRFDDLAILELEKDIEFSNFAIPSCIATTSEAEVQGDWFEITGFGSSRFRFDDDEREPPVLRHGWMEVVNPLNEGRQFKAVDPRGINAPRGGDSGGPAYIDILDTNYVIGISNYVEPGYTAVFSSVGNHYRQICHHTGLC